MLLCYWLYGEEKGTEKRRHHSTDSDCAKGFGIRCERCPWPGASSRHGCAAIQHWWLTVGSRRHQPGPGMGSQPPHQQASATACPVKPESFMEWHYFKPIVSYFRFCVRQATVLHCFTDMRAPSSSEALPWNASIVISCPALWASGSRYPLALSAPRFAVPCHTCREAPRGWFSSPMLIIALQRAMVCLQLGCRMMLCSPSPSARRRRSRDGCRGSQRYRVVAISGKKIGFSIPGERRGDRGGLGMANRPWLFTASSQPTPWRHGAKAGGRSFKTGRCFHTACHYTMELCHERLSVLATASKRGRKKWLKENNLKATAYRDISSGPGGPLGPQRWGGEVGEMRQWVHPVLTLR